MELDVYVEQMGTNGNGGRTLSWIRGGVLDLMESEISGGEKETSRKMGSEAVGEIADKDQVPGTVYAQKRRAKTDHVDQRGVSPRSQSLIIGAAVKVGESLVKMVALQYHSSHGQRLIERPHSYPHQCHC